MTWPPPLLPRLVSIAGRNEAAVSEAARRYGFAGYATDWRALVEDERIGLFDNGGPNALHAEPRRGRSGQARAVREAARPRRRRKP
jgi:predicted dehydrogenase